ncbi:MAG: hypothetical protein A2Y95_04445 [Deltaproteobacteria bacterium RBG_13_65_10]|nr:MAG: hypothetical protein A2Y95_04445 [Deltaproteobacteria bacterium RBG_13_65_10]
MLSAAFCALVLALWAFLVIGALREGDRFRLRPAPPPDPPPTVSVVVPARNEAHQIAACVASLRAQTLVPCEIVVVDDASSDGTADVVRALPDHAVPVILVQGTPPPRGWVGKNHALVQGLPRTTGEWFLFTDADTDHAPDALASALAFAIATGSALVSLTGDQRAEGFFEKIVQPLVFRLLDALYPLSAANSQDPARAAANGIYLLLRRDAYEAVGTHAALRGEILEDVAIARAVRAAGWRVAFLRGADHLRVRMYREGGALWEGWTKNLWLLLGASPARAALAAVAALVAGPLPLAMLLYDGAAAWVAITGAIGAEAWLRTRGRGDPGWALALPLGGLVLAAMIGDSARRHLGGKGIRWKGRNYPSSP